MKLIHANIKKGTARVDIDIARLSLYEIALDFWTESLEKDLEKAKKKLADPNYANSERIILNNPNPTMTMEERIKHLIVHIEQLHIEHDSVRKIWEEVADVEAERPGRAE